ncbi:MAG: site-2 protease family protein [Candidatus Nanohaloarchaea archaeon]
MVEVSPRLVFLIVFVSGLAAFLYWDRDNIERHFILFYRRTERGIDLIDRIAKRFPRFWNYYGWLGVATGLASMVISFYLMAQVYGQMLVSRSVENGPSLVLPGLVSQNQFQAGVSFVPIEFWVIGVGIIMVVHEFSHGIVARTEGFKINSVGWIVMGIFPGAFVEPEGERMLPAEGEQPGTGSEGGMWGLGDWKSRLKVLGAGSLANYITAAVFFMAAVGVAGAITQPSQVFYVADEGFPAAEAGMTNGTLHQINGKDIEGVGDVQNISETIQVGDHVAIWTSEGNFTVTAVEKKGFDTGYIGIRVGQQRVIKDSYSDYSGGLQWFVSMLQTIAFLNFVIGLFNMLPLKPLDGGLMADTLLGEYYPDKVKYLDRFSLFGWALILSGILLGVIVGL